MDYFPSRPVALTDHDIFYTSSPIRTIINRSGADVVLGGRCKSGSSHFPCNNIR